ncbi:hypothetical protein [Streptomyces sp. MAR4 CNX-425]|uniref:hypothetical protein n=1 Tax=Streptomyces sp. MAR4 CNX-425 TaxID=3406343 RepID=UPI003B50DC48
MTLTTRHRRRPRRLILAATAAGVLTIGGLGAALAQDSTGTAEPVGDPGAPESAVPSREPAEPTPVPSSPQTPSKEPAEPTPAPSAPQTPSKEPAEPTPAPSAPQTPSQEPSEPAPVPSAAQTPSKEPREATPLPEGSGTPSPLAPGEPTPEWEN